MIIQQVLTTILALQQHKQAFQDDNDCFTYLESEKELRQTAERWAKDL
jgi:hypothetical protein